MGDDQCGCPEGNQCHSVERLAQPYLEKWRSKKVVQATNGDDGDHARWNEATPEGHEHDDNREGRDITPGSRDEDALWRSIVDNYGDRVSLGPTSTAVQRLLELTQAESAFTFEARE